MGVESPIAQHGKQDVTAPACERDEGLVVSLSLTLLDDCLVFAQEDHHTKSIVVCGNHADVDGSCQRRNHTHSVDALADRLGTKDVESHSSWTIRALRRRGADSESSVQSNAASDMGSSNKRIERIALTRDWNRVHLFISHLLYHRQSTQRLFAHKTLRARDGHEFGSLHSWGLGVDHTLEKERGGYCCIAVPQRMTRG